MAKKAKVSQYASSCKNLAFGELTLTLASF